MELFAPDHPTSTTGSALIALEEFRVAGGSPESFAACTVEGESVRVKISVASYEYLSGIAGRDRLRMLIRALPFAEADDKRARIESSDFALAQGKRTQAGVDDWHKENRVRSRSIKPPTLKLPPGVE